MSWLARSIANSLRLDDDDDEVRPEDGEEAVDLNDDDDVDVRKSPPNDAALNPASKFPHRFTESLDLEDVDLGGDRDSDFNRVSEIGSNRDAGDGGEEDGDGADHSNHGRGVKEDLSEFTETLTRQLWGVASFLAPPPPPPPPLPLRAGSNLWGLDQRGREVVECSGSGDEGSYNGEDYYGSETQFQEFPHSFLHIGMPEPEEEEDVFEDAVGITEEALDFAEDTAHHPETWLNFPLMEEEEFEDFEISDSQHKHAQAIEHLVPTLAALRRELCPVHMTEGYFWMVYFVFLHSRISKHDADHLSTPQLVKARAIWMKELQKQTNPEPDWIGSRNLHSEDNINFPYDNLDHSSFEDTPTGNASQKAFPLNSIASEVMNDYSEAENIPHENNEIRLIDKSIYEEHSTSKPGNQPLSSPSFKVPIQEFDEHEDDWLEDDSDLEGYVTTSNAFINEDVSFSDLEDDIDMPVKSKVVAK
ncbi:OLC1v1016898C1 [Oldenlandia corymbosa var. corymbosa]|uniref:OLC1v1016898C1 n=1 Tax=Oldenlandia corymbosa var. corymbosa TaxID=529605 RepID=A0AAV1E884_OLDCO|nr:OLC1v1016898C1 [Oldenlandia corymbosa var. corymbosa]